MSTDFYLIGFPFFENYCIFTHLFDFVCHVDGDEPLKAQQATATVNDATRGLSCNAFYLPQLENATATFSSSNVTIIVVLLCQFGKPNQKDE